MRQVPWAVGVSIVAHGVAIAGIAALDLASDPKPLLATTPPRVELVTPPPGETVIAVDIGFVRVPDVATLPASGLESARVSAGRGATSSRGGVEPGTGTADVGANASTGTDTADVGADAGTGTQRSPYFDLRRGEQVKLRFDGSFQSFDPSAGPRPEVQLHTGHLQQDGGGFRSQQGPFSARVDKDGSVRLEDASNVNIRIAAPSPRSIGDAVDAWYRSDKGPIEDAATGSVDPADRSKAIVAPVVRGGFDITDGLMRHLGVGDPYASKKLAFLDATRDERVQMGAKHRAEQLARTDLLVRENLERLWRAVRDPAARRQALFELWDEVVESGDARVVEAGAAARRQIVGFIRARLPAGSALGYSASELRTLNASRQSRTAFAPYDALPPN